jgi:hypothetical protein
VYLSTGAWNTAEALRDFMARHGYPPGPSPAHGLGTHADRLVRSGQEHKRSSCGDSSRISRSCVGCSWATTVSTTRRCTPRQPPQSPTGCWACSSASSAPPNRWSAAGRRPQGRRGRHRRSARGGSRAGGRRVRSPGTAPRTEPRPGPRLPLSAHPGRGRAQDVGMSAPPSSETRSPIRI